MTVPAGTASATSRFANMGFDLHLRNMASLRPDDVLLPSIGGAGSTLLGGILLELGLGYVDLNRDTLHADGTVTPPSDAISQRIRTGGARATSGSVASPRLMKTHLPAGEFIHRPFGAVWLLVRDPRDAVYSWYRYHRAFAELDWERVPDDFAEFLGNPFFTELRPVDNWWSFYDDWTELVRRRGVPLTVLRFEDLKSDAPAAMRAALATAGIRVPDPELARACADSSYPAMRRREEQNADTSSARVMRSGRTGEWRDWMTPQLARHFASPQLHRTAGRYGYALAEPQTEPDSSG